MGTFHNRSSSSLSSKQTLHGSFLALLLASTWLLTMMSLPTAESRPLSSWNILDQPYYKRATSYIKNHLYPSHTPYHDSSTIVTLEYYVQVGLYANDLGILIDAINTTTMNEFGQTQLFNFNVTETADPNSTLLGYIRGFNVQASTNSEAHGVEVEILSYDDGTINGTVSIQGHIGDSTNEVAIVGGTGDFRGARGYGIITFVNATSSVYLYHHSLYFL